MEGPYAGTEDLSDARELNVLAQLYDALDARPRDIEIHQMLLEAWKAVGEEDMAFGIATILLELSPGNKLAQDCIRRHRKKPAESVPMQNMMVNENELEEGYQSLRFEAEVLKVELASDYFRNIAEDQDEILKNLHSISKGDVALVVSGHQPLSVREAAREILVAPRHKATDVIVEDLESVVRWMTGQMDTVDTDKIRERLMKRRSRLEAALPESLQQNCAEAFRQVEREYLQKRYMNTETMYGDKVEDIPRANFFASEDNYAFDMKELTRAIESQDGVMRNPLSRQMFTESDIETILAHPLGRRLKPLREAQGRLKKGVRATTIDKIDRLGDLMLNDQSMDAGPSRKGIDEFLAYITTLPSSERQTIRQLKIPAKDKNTNQPFDYSIHESVNDAKAGVTCYHKVGDFLSQAASYLRRQ